MTDLLDWAPPGIGVLAAFLRSRKFPVTPQLPAATAATADSPAAAASTFLHRPWPNSAGATRIWA